MINSYKQPTLTSFDRKTHFNSQQSHEIIFVNTKIVEIFTPWIYQKKLVQIVRKNIRNQSRFRVLNLLL